MKAPSNSKPPAVMMSYWARARSASDLVHVAHPVRLLGDRHQQPLGSDVGLHLVVADGGASSRRTCRRRGPCGSRRGRGTRARARARAGAARPPRRRQVGEALARPVDALAAGRQSRPDALPVRPALAGVVDHLRRGRVVLVVAAHAAGGGRLDDVLVGLLEHAHGEHGRGVRAEGDQLEAEVLLRRHVPGSPSSHQRSIVAPQGESCMGMRSGSSKLSALSMRSRPVMFVSCERAPRTASRRRSAWARPLLASGRHCQCGVRLSGRRQCGPRALNGPAAAPCTISRRSDGPLREDGSCSSRSRNGGSRSRRWRSSSRGACTRLIAAATSWTSSPACSSVWPWRSTSATCSLFD